MNMEEKWFMAFQMFLPENVLTFSLKRKLLNVCGRLVGVLSDPESVSTEHPDSK